MIIPEKKIIEVYLNSKCNNYFYIGSYGVIYGSMGMELIQYVYPEEVNKISAWIAIKDSISPADLLNHLIQLKNDLDQIKSLELYGESFYNNYIRLQPEVEKLNSILLNDLDSYKEENILWVDKGESINFNTNFNWSENYEWARRDPDCIVLFEEELDEYHTVFLSEVVYDEVIELLTIIWKKLLTT